MKYKCCLCGKEFDGFGNNPYPLCDADDYDSRCCDDCNSKYVILARIGKYNGGTTEKDIKHFMECVDFFAMEVKNDN